MNRECFVRGRNWRLGAAKDTRHQEEAQHNTRSGTRENRLDTLTQRIDELVHHVCGMCMSESEESCESPSQHYMYLPTYEPNTRLNTRKPMLNQTITSLSSLCPFHWPPVILETHPHRHQPACSALLPGLTEWQSPDRSVQLLD